MRLQSNTRCATRSLAVAVESLESRLCLSAGGGPHVYDPGSTVDGKSLGSWAESWSKWAYSFPIQASPLVDATGANGSVDQPKGVFYLAGSSSPGTLSRTITVPSGTKVFFPVLSTIYVEFPTDPQDPASTLRGYVKGTADGFTGAFATIDGKSVAGLTTHREQDPNPNGFRVNMPEDNVFDFPGFDLPAGNYGPSVTDGLWLMTQPFSVGDHTIHFGGTIPDFGFTIDISYTLHVVPKGQYDAPAPKPAAATFGKEQIKAKDVAGTSAGLFD